MSGGLNLSFQSSEAHYTTAPSNGSPRRKSDRRRVSLCAGELRTRVLRYVGAQRLELLTGTHRTTCYRALRLNGRFARHLYSDGTMLCWR